MRELKIEEMELISGGNPAGAIAGASVVDRVVGDIYDGIKNQTKEYVDGFNSNGISGVIAATPAAKVIFGSVGAIGSIRSSNNSSQSGNNYCGDGANYP